jgi:hypothetical protein
VTPTQALLLALDQLGVLTTPSAMARLLGVKRQQWSGYLLPDATQPSTRTLDAWLRRLDAAGYSIRLSVGSGGWLALSTRRDAPAPKVGDYVQYADEHGPVEHGPVGQVEQIDGPRVYVRWVYGLDVAGRPMTSLSAHLARNLWPTTAEVYEAHRNRRHKPFDHERL